MERRFSCTACGKCCYGSLPLSIAEALAHADRFPLMMIWTTVRQGAPSFNLTAELGLTIQLKKRKQAAVQIAPTAYIPTKIPCPELTSEGLCAIHTSKPRRCRTMPFFPYRDASDQDDLLLPRPGWLCDTSTEAPLVYRDKEILDPSDFKAERDQLTQDAVILKPYGQWLLDSVPTLRMELQKIAMKPSGGQVLVAFSTLIPRLPKVDIYAIARRQAGVMRAFADKTQGDPDLKAFHKRYVEGADEWEKVARGPTQGAH